MKQTAVEWLLEQIENKNGKEFTSYYTEFIQQAKEMEKQQIVNAYDEGVIIHWGEQYYNDTFKEIEKL
jgi:hypothetical protein